MEHRCNVEKKSADAKNRLAEPKPRAPLETSDDDEDSKLPEGRNIQGKEVENDDDEEEDDNSVDIASDATLMGIQTEILDVVLPTQMHRAKHDKNLEQRRQHANKGPSDTRLKKDDKIQDVRDNCNRDKKYSESRHKKKKVEEKRKTKSISKNKHRKKDKEKSKTKKKKSKTIHN